MSRFTRKGWFRTNHSGFTLVETLLATALFGLLVTGFVGVYWYGEESSILLGNRSRAILFAEEGIEAARNIKDESFSNLTAGNHGLTLSSGVWSFSGTQDTSGIFTRQISVTSVDSKRKAVSSTVTWNQNPQRTGSIVLTTEFTDWSSQSAIPLSCNEYAIEQGYSSGTCRSTSQACTVNGEIYLSSGDIYCTGGPSVDTCCVQ